MTTLTAYNRPSVLGRTVFDDLFRFNDFTSMMDRTTKGYPVADIFRTKDGSTALEFALAGFRKSELSVEVKPENNSITVSANTEDNEAEVGTRRIARRSFSKTYVNYDSNLDLTQLEATFEDGLLTITIPVKPEIKPLQIDIK